MFEQNRQNFYLSQQSLRCFSKKQDGDSDYSNAFASMVGQQDTSKMTQAEKDAAQAEINRK